MNTILLLKFSGNSLGESKILSPAALGCPAGVPFHQEWLKTREICEIKENRLTVRSLVRPRRGSQRALGARAGIKREQKGDTPGQRLSPAGPSGVL